MGIPRVLLIDSENVGKQFLKGFNTVKEGDKIIYFHRVSSGEIPIDILATLASTKATVQFIEHSSTSSNAMDFQICTYLGYVMAQIKEKADYYIVSRDRGYEASLELVKKYVDKSITLEIVPDFSLGKEVSEQEEQIKDLLKNYPKPVQRVAIKAFKMAGRNKQQLHSILEKELYKDGKDIYQILKKAFY